MPRGIFPVTTRVTGWGRAFGCEIHNIPAPSAGARCPSADGCPCVHFAPTCVQGAGLCCATGSGAKLEANAKRGACGGIYESNMAPASLPALCEPPRSREGSPSTPALHHRFHEGCAVWLAAAMAQVDPRFALPGIHRAIGHDELPHSAGAAETLRPAASWCSG